MVHDGQKAGSENDGLCGLQGKRAPEIAQKVQEALVAKLSEINSAPAPSAERDDPEGPSDDKAAGRKEAAEDLRE